MRFLLTFLIFFVSCSDYKEGDKLEVDGQCGVITVNDSGLEITEVWVCHNPDSENHGNICKDSCFNPNSEYSYCWFLSSQSCGEPLEFEWQFESCHLVK